MAQYYTLPTAIGEAKIANAIALGGTITISELAVGDGGGATPVPDSDRTTLVNEVRRAPINTSVVDPDNPSWIVVEQVLPPDIGGWTIREVGLYDADGDLVAYGNYPETYKPVLSEGSGRTQTIRFVMQVSDTAAVTLKVDPSVVLATRKYVDTGDASTAQAASDALQQHVESRDHPAATTTALGFVEKATPAEAKTGAANKFPDSAGVLEAVRQFGVGSQSAIQIADADAVSAAGVYGTRTNTLNIPVPGAGHTLWHHQWDANAGTQLFIPYDRDAMYFRTFRDGDWNPWASLWNQSNLTPAAIGAETPSGAQAKIDSAVNGLLSGAPGALDTLNELAAALNDDANFATTINNALSKRALSDWITTVGLASDDPESPYVKQTSTGNIINLVPSFRSVAAGNGLTGGGSLGTNRVITLGPPGSLNAFSTNNVSGSSHTHSIDAVSIVNRGLAGVGSYALLRFMPAEDREAGDMVNGSNLRYASVSSAHTNAPPGTWRLMGDIDGASDATHQVSLWQRVA